MTRIDPIPTRFLLILLSGLTLSSCAGSMEQLKDESLSTRLPDTTASIGGPADFRAYAAYLKALEAERRGELDDAMKLLLRAMDLDPKAATVQARLGRVYAEKRQLPEAIDASRKALEIDPKHYAANLQLAELLQASGQHEQAEGYFKRAIEAAPDQEDAYLELANLYRSQNRPKEGIAVIEQYRSRGGELVSRFLLLRASLYKDMEQLDQAEKDILSLLDEDNEYRGQAQRALLDLYLAEGNLSEAAERLEQLHKQKPWLDWINAALVQFYALLANVEALNSRLIDVTESDPGLGEELRLEAVEELASRREFDKAMQVLQPILKHSADNDRAFFYAGFLYARRKDYDRALEMYGRVAESSELYTRAVEQRALALQAKGDTAKAVALIQSYLEGEPDADDARMTLVTVYTQAKRPADALKVIDEMLTRNPGDVEATSQRAFVLNDMGRDEEAVQMLRGAVEKQKNQARLYDALALVHAENNRYDAAIDVLKEAIKVLPDNETLRFSLGSYYDKLKMHDEAVAQMQKILELNENSAEAMNFIGYTWADLGVRLSEAEVLIKRALELDPNNGYMTDSLGWLYYKQERYPEAVKTLERAVELTSMEPVIVEHLGDAYLKVGRKDKALEAYHRAATEVKVQEKPEPEDVKRIQQKYEALKAEPGVKEPTKGEREPAKGAKEPGQSGREPVKADGMPAKSDKGPAKGDKPPAKSEKTPAKGDREPDKASSESKK